MRDRLLIRKSCLVTGGIISATSMLRQLQYQKLIFKVQFYSKLILPRRSTDTSILSHAYFHTCRNINDYHFLYECSSTLRIPYRTFTVIWPVQEKDGTLKMRQKH